MRGSEFHSCLLWLTNSSAPAELSDAPIRRPGQKFLSCYSFRLQAKSDTAGTRRASRRGMPHFYPKHLPDFPYIGKLSYALEFTTEQRALLLRARPAIELVVQQFLRAARE